MGFTCKTWEGKEILKCVLHKNGYFVVKFACRKDKEDVMSTRWFMGSKTLIMWDWSPDFEFEKDKLATMPVWIQLHGINYAYWSEKFLSKLVSRIGRPLWTDQVTSGKGRVDYARVLVEVNTNLEVVKSVKWKDCKGEIHFQAVTYEWLPAHCSKCHLWGHKDECKWVSRPSVPKNKRKIKSVYMNRKFRIVLRVR